MWKTVTLFWEGKSWVGRARSCPWHSNYFHTKWRTLAAVSERKKMQEANSFETLSFWLWELGRLMKETSLTTPLKLALSQRRSERDHKALRSFHTMKSKISALFSSINLADFAHLTTDLWSTTALWKDICLLWWQPQPVHIAVAHIWQSPSLC